MQADTTIKVHAGLQNRLHSSRVNIRATWRD